MMNNDIPLCVDLDGTLLNSDILFESFFQLLKKNVLYKLYCVFWLFRGKAYLKSKISERVELDVKTLPYNGELLDFLKEEKSKGRRLVLVTASHEKYAQQIAQHLGLFDDVLASNINKNLSGAVKRDELVSRYGEDQFDYAGNSRADIAVWEKSRHAILVSPERGVGAATISATVEKTFQKTAGGANEYFRAMRPHQWLKNALIFIPLFVSHSWHESSLLILSISAFFAFSACASAVYIINDFLDLPEDRNHPRKCKRPFAAGTASIKVGLLLAIVLLMIATVIAITVGLEFAFSLLVYYLLTIAYSFALKQIVLVDVLALAGLYTMRIIAGAAAIGVVPSFWLLAFSMFLFLSLAMLKRFTELISIKDFEENSAVGRGYHYVDLETLNSLGVASGYLAVLVLALYINSPEVKVLYERPEVIWMLCPLLLYWISRAWLMSRRGNMHDDPVVFAIEDRVSRVLVVVGGVIVLLAV